MNLLTRIYVLSLLYIHSILKCHHKSEINSHLVGNPRNILMKYVCFVNNNMYKFYLKQYYAFHFSIHLDGDLEAILVNLCKKTAFTNSIHKNNIHKFY